MVESSDKINERIKRGELNSDPRPFKPKKKNILYRIGKYYLDYIKILLGIDEDSIGKSKKSIPLFGRNYPEKPSVRDTYRADPPPTSHAPNPYTYDPIAYDNLRIYLQGQDGRGDPKPCDCDHDR